jgi:hypothetical protein
MPRYRHHASHCGVRPYSLTPAHCMWSSPSRYMSARSVYVPACGLFQVLLSRRASVVWRMNRCWPFLAPLVAVSIPYRIRQRIWRSYG